MNHSLVPILVGPIPVYWQSPSQAPSYDDLYRLAPHLEQKCVDTFGAPQRRYEYLRARHLIRQISGFSGPLLSGDNGVPTWPPNYHGSITHKSGFVGVTLLPQEGPCLGVGIDAEEVSKVKKHLAPRICSAPEMQYIDMLIKQFGESFCYWLTLIFSFKESLFKCHFPIGGTFFYFHDAQVQHVDPTVGSITAKLLLPTNPYVQSDEMIGGHFCPLPGQGPTESQDFMLTAVTLVPPSPGIHLVL